MPLVPPNDPKLPEDPNPTRTSRIRKYTKWSWVIALGFIVIGDILGVPNAEGTGETDTPSQTARDASRIWWSIPLVWGAVTTHLFVNFGQPEAFTRMFLLLSGFGVAAIIANLVSYFAYDYMASPELRTAMLFFGMGFGVWLWGQNA